MKETCPLCEEIAFRVIYMGFPMKACSNEECSLMWGFWDFILDLFGFDGNLMVYECNYFRALYLWFTDDGEE